MIKFFNNVGAHDGGGIGECGYYWNIEIGDLIKVSDDVVNRGLKIKKPEIDPFDEENWGYVKEQNSEKFEIGDIVKVRNRSYDYKKCGDNCGIIIKIGFHCHCVEFFKHIDGHDGVGIGKNGYCWNIDIGDLIKVSDSAVNKKPKIKRPDLDPFDEEDWGYVKEGLEQLDFKNVIILISSKEEHNFLMYYLTDNTKYKWANGRNPLDEEFLDSYPHIFINDNLKIYRTQDVENIIKSKNAKVINIKELGFKKFKRIKNKEMDPFNEENWGFEEIT